VTLSKIGRTHARGENVMSTGLTPATDQTTTLSYLQKRESVRYMRLPKAMMLLTQRSQGKNVGNDQ
jgi:hypothetical protein